MAPSHSRQLLILTIPTIAVILSYLWFKRKRTDLKSDPGDCPEIEIKVEEENLVKELEEAAATEVTKTPEKKISRSLSGVESAPIDIIVPRELRSQKTSPVIISDEDLDLQIEKIKSMKSVVEPYHISKALDTVDSPRKISPKPEIFDQQQTQMKPVKKQNMPKPKSPKGDPAKTKPSAKSASKKTPGKEIEEKFENLKLNPADKNKQVNPETLKTNEHAQSHERDSANNSPEVMLPSPSMSSISDNHSEGSNDSGKGGSEVATPPPPCQPQVESKTVYEFLIEQSLCGQLIGKDGRFVNRLKSQSKTNVTLRLNPSDHTKKVCSLYGTKSQIEKAIRMIQRRFQKVEDFNTDQVFLSDLMSTIPIQTGCLFLKLVEGMNNDTTVSCIVSVNHVFMQQPSHPSFPGLQVLHSVMSNNYNVGDAPDIPKPLHSGVICATKSADQWQRIMVLSNDIATDTSYVTFLDYGGYAYVDNSNLKQLRQDFLTLPFQSAECVLFGIAPLISDQAEWSQEALDYVTDTVTGRNCLTQIIEYTENDVPLVSVYVLTGSTSFVYLNQELILKGLVRCIDPQSPYYDPGVPLVKEEETSAVTTA